MTQPRPEPKVIIIPAKEETPEEKEKKRSLRVAAYCRVSTDKKEQLTSYENQKAYYTQKIMTTPNWTMVTSSPMKVKQGPLPVSARTSCA